MLLTKDEVFKKALLFNTRSDFAKAHSGLYARIRKSGWEAEAFMHMKKRFIHTYEDCCKKAASCKTKGEFESRYSGQYNAALRFQWLDKICHHMVPLKKEKGFWSKQRCHEAAKHCASRSEFCRRFSSAFQASHKNGWIEFVCSHMEFIGHKYLRAIYAYEFEDNSVYVGLTHNYKARDNHHRKMGRLKEKLNSVGFKYVKFDKFITVERAQRAEQRTIEKYRREGWTILNIKKGGAIGGVGHWTVDGVLDEASKYTRLQDFRKHSNKAYHAGRRLGIKGCEYFWLHQPMPKGHWKDLKNVLFEARKYSCQSDFRNNSPEAYQGAKKYGHMTNATKHMRVDRMPSGYWTLDRIKTAALAFNTRSDFMKKNGAAYNAAFKKGILNQVCSHMKIIRVSWSKEAIYEEVKKYQSRRDFCEKSRGAASAAQRMGIYQDVTKHLKRWRRLKFKGQAARQGAE